MADPLLLGPAALFAAATAYGTAVAATEAGPRGEPLGLQVPGSVRTHLLLGWGAAVAAPWPMPVIAAVAAARGGPRSAPAARTIAGIGTAALLGILVEPATWGRRPASSRAALAVPLHLLGSVAMVWAGTHRLRQQAERSGFTALGSISEPR